MSLQTGPLTADELTELAKELSPSQVRRAKALYIHLGKRSYEIKFARWDAANHVGLIQVYDDQGEAFIVESDGLAPNEQRQAVASFAMRRAASLADIMHGPRCPCVNCT